MKLVLTKKKTKNTYHITDVDCLSTLYTICNQKIKLTHEWEHFAESLLPRFSIEFLKNKTNLCKKCKKALDNVA